MTDCKEECSTVVAAVTSALNRLKGEPTTLEIGYAYAMLEVARLAIEKAKAELMGYLEF